MFVEYHQEDYVDKKYYEYEYKLKPDDLGPFSKDLNYRDYLKDVKWF